MASSSASGTLSDYAIDLINDAKGCSDISKKIYYLEQVKEIILYRDASLLEEILPNVMDFMIEKSSDIKRFLLGVAFDALTQSFAVALPSVLNLYNYLIGNELADSMSKKLCSDMKGFYEKIVMHIAQMPPMKSRTALSAAVVDPKLLWEILRNITANIIQIVSSTKRDNLKMVSLKFIESVILFGLPSPTTDVAPAKPLDPRLQRAARAAGTGPTTSNVIGASGGEQTASAISLHHPFISRDELESEAEALWSKLLLWASKGGASGRAFSPELMSSLGQSIATITTARPRLLTNASVAIVFLIQGKGSICGLMPGATREALARSVHRLIRSLTGRKDEDGSIGKLRSAVDTIEKMGFGEGQAVKVDISEDRKRPHSEISVGDEELGGGHDEIDEQQRKHIRDRAIADLNATDKIFSKSATVSVLGSMAASSTDVGQSVNTSDSIGSGSSSGAVLVTPAISTETELLSTFADTKAVFTIAMKLAAVGTVIPAVATTQSLTTTSASFLQLRPSNALPPAESYALLSFEALMRMLGQFDELYLGSAPSQRVSLQSKLISRTVLTMSAMEMTANEGKCTQFLALFTALPPPHVLGKLADGIPGEVNVSSALWILVSFVLSSRKIRDDEFESRAWTGYFTLLLSCLSELHARAVSDEAIIDSDEKPPAMTLYEHICLVTVARLLSFPFARSFLRSLISKLPTVPITVLRLLRLLLFTGSKAIVGSGREKSVAEKDKTKSVKFEALQLMLVTTESSNEQSAVSALHMLLWCCLSDDFEIRHKTISGLLSGIASRDGWVLETAITFALQSVVSLVASDDICNILRLASAEEGNGKKDLTDGAMNVDNESEVDVDRLPPKLTYTLLHAAKEYDCGKSFDGSFSRAPIGSASKVDGHVKKHLHLLSQLVILPGLYGLLRVYFDLNYAASKVGSSPTQTSSTISHAAVVEVATETSVAVETAVHEQTASIEDSLNGVIQRLVRADLTAIIPSLSMQEDIVSIFDSIKTVHGTSSNFNILEHSIALLQHDYQMPASSSMLSSVQKFVKEYSHALVSEADDMLELFDAAISDSPWLLDGIDYRCTKSVRLLIPVISGYSASAIETVLPYVLRAVGQYEPVMKAFIDRLAKCRPPPVSRSTLVVLLHRIDPDSKLVCFKQKTAADRQKIVNNSIKICIDSESDFTAEVWKEALGKLLEETSIVNSFMRTVILSYNAHPELKKFVLAEVLPTLVRKRVWASSKSVWDGVLIAFKALAVSRDAEPSLRAMLSLPGPQLQNLLKYKEVRAPISKVLKALSETERAQVLAGGLTVLESSDTSQQVSGTSSEGTHEDKLKSKLIDELLV